METLRKLYGARIQLEKEIFVLQQKKLNIEAEVINHLINERMNYFIKVDWSKLERALKRETL